MNEIKNLYQIDLDIEDLIYVFAETQSQALEIAFESKSLKHTDYESINVLLVCQGNEIINYKN